MREKGKTSRRIFLMKSSFGGSKLIDNSSLYSVKKI